MMDISDAVCTSLCRVLGEGIDIHRCMAARALGRIGYPGGVKALIAALLDEDEDVRSDAAAALARLAPLEAGPQLMDNLLGDPCTSVKLNAIEALSRLRHPEVVPWLRRMLKGRDQAIAWDEAGFHADGWDDWVDVQVKALEALAGLGDAEAVPEIVAAVDDEFAQDLSEVGFKALAKLGAPGIKALAGYLDTGAGRRRQRAAAVLAASDAKAARPAVARALRDRSRDVRLAAARALAKCHPADQRLIPLFSDKDPEIRAQAVGLCGGHHPVPVGALIGDRSAAVLRAVLDLAAEAPELLPRDAVAETARAVLRGAHANAAASAARALAAVAPETAFDDLVAQLANPERPLEVRLGAVAGLAGIGGTAVVQALTGVLGDDQRQLRLEAMAALARLAAAEAAWPNPSGETLLAALGGTLLPERHDETPAETVAEVDAEAVPEAESEAVPEAFPRSTLQSILGAESPAARHPEPDAIELTPEDLDRLALAARTPRKSVVSPTPRIAPHLDLRRFAARVLGELARDQVAAALAEVLRDGDKELRLAAADSLARIAARAQALPPPVRHALSRALADGEADMRRLAVRALGAAGGQAAADLLRDRLGDTDSFVRAEALAALADLGAEVPEVAPLLDDPDPGVRLAAARTTAAVGGAGAADTLVEFAFAHDGCHGRAAARLLRDLGAAAASARFLETLDDPDRLRLWPVAIEALEELNRPDASTTQPNPQEGARPS